MIEVRGEQFDEGSDYAQVTRDPTGQVETFRIFDAALGRPYFRRWLEQSLAALEEVAARHDRTA